LTSETDARTQTVTLGYDALGRIVTKQYPGGATVQWVYDDPAVTNSIGRLTRVTDTSAVTTYSYDALGRIAQMGRLLDGTTYTTSYTFDARSRVLSQTFPDGETVNFAYNDAGWLSSIPGYVTSITYNARGQRLRTDYGNGAVTTWTYHPDTLLLTSRTTSSSAGTLQGFTYAYDVLGNLTQINDVAGWTGTRTFTYDGLNRLTSAIGTFGGSNQASVSETYRYNAIGNITQKAGVDYTYGDPLHPAAVTATSDGRTYGYDANGNMISGAGRTLSYDTDNRIGSITNGSGTTTFAYDYLGRRLRKTTSAGATRYPLGNYEIAPDGVTTKYLGDVAKKSDGQVLFYHRDHLHSVHVITDSAGARVQLIEYDPWGRISRQEGNVDVSHRFTDQEFDSETGLYYFDHRYYDPVLARFTSPDPFVPYPMNPQSFNRYSYVMNNPVNRVDPDGFEDGDADSPGDTSSEPGDPATPADPAPTEEESSEDAEALAGHHTHTITITVTCCNSLPGLQSDPVLDAFFASQALNFALDGLAAIGETGTAATSAAATSTSGGGGAGTVAPGVEGPGTSGATGSSPTDAVGARLAAVRDGQHRGPLYGEVPNPDPKIN
jgi:RHS repeat-associated protein